MAKCFDEPGANWVPLHELTNGRIKLTSLPLDGTLKQALEGGEHSLWDAVSFLQLVHRAGRPEAGVFLMGLLAYSGNDWKQREMIVDKLSGFDTQGCADFLMAELRRVPGSNSTRGYLNAILKVLGSMPIKLTHSGLRDLVSDPRFSYKMRNKILDLVDDNRWLGRDYPREARTESQKSKFTPLQGRYLAFIHYYTRLHGQAPAETDMQMYFKVSPPSVHQMVLTLEKHGLITRTPGKARSISIRLAPEELPELE